MSKSCPCTINLNISIARMPSFLPLLLLLLQPLLPRLLKWRQSFRPPRNPRVATWRRRTRTKPMTTKHQYYKQQFQQLCQQQSVPPKLDNNPDTATTTTTHIFTSTANTNTLDHHHVSNSGPEMEPLISIGSLEEPTHTTSREVVQHPSVTASPVAG